MPVHGTITTNDGGAALVLAEAGAGLAYVMEPTAAEAIARGALRVVLEDYAASVPGFFLYFPGRAQVSPAMRAFLDVARGFARDALATPRPAPAAARDARPAPARR